MVVPATAEPLPKVNVSFKKYLLTGLLVWLPLAVTIWVLQAALGLLDGVFGWFLNAGKAVLPSGAAPLIDLLLQIPGLGVIVVVVMQIVFRVRVF